MDRPFVSYAQHGEDVVLWRALGEREGVTYVDVGAFHPTVDSVTHALYARGWRGVNIEPQPERLAAFEQERPDDVNLAVAVGDHDGTARLSVPANQGWATTRPAPDAAPAAFTYDVPVRTLATLLPELGLTRVDVLKADVAGAERDVVEGLLAGTVRPTVCVVAGGPRVGDAPTSVTAVDLLVGAGYHHCLFDGLNHYLTTDPGLEDALRLPAGPLDDFVTAAVDRLLSERRSNHATIAALAEENVRLRASSEAGEGPAPTDEVPSADAVQVAPAPRTPSRVPRPTRTSPGAAAAAAAALADLPADQVPTAPLPVVVDDGTGRIAHLGPAALRRRRRRMFAQIVRGLSTDLSRATTLERPVSVLTVALRDTSPLQAVSLLFRAVLGRQAEPEGLHAWAGNVEAGVPLLEVARALAATEEAQQCPADRRAEVASDLELWAALTVADELGLASPLEGRPVAGLRGADLFVEALYEVALRRRPTPGELEFETSKLLAGTGREWMIRAFVARPEVRTRFLGTTPGLSARLRRLRDRRHLLGTLRLMVLEAEARRVAQLQYTLAAAGERLRTAAADAVDAWDED